MEARLIRLALVLTALIALSGAVASAQETTPNCPEEHACVPYAGGMMAIDPAWGFVQTIVVEDHELTIRDLNGKRVVPGPIKLATFLADGDTYILIDERIVERKGPYRNAELHAVYIPKKVE